MAKVLHPAPDAHWHITPKGEQPWWDFSFRPDHHDCPGTTAQCTSEIAPDADERSFCGLRWTPALCALALDETYKA